MTVETKSIIIKGMEKLLTDVEGSVVVGVHEDMSPNDIEYGLTLETERVDALDFMLSILTEHQEEL